MGELKKELGLKEVLATVITSVIGGGLFLTTIQIQDKTPVGSSLIFSYILAAIPAGLIALCYMVLSSAISSSGGEYVFVSKILDPFIGFIVTWSRWFAMIAIIAAMSVGDITILTHFFDILNLHNISIFIEANIQFIAIILVLIFLFINYRGVKLYGRVQTAMMVLLLIGISSFILFGMPHVNMEYLTGSFKPNFSLIAQASSLIFFSYLGFSVITDAGDEVKNAKKTIPRGILISLVTIAAIYILVAIVVYGSMSPSFYSSYDFTEGSIAQVGSYFIPHLIAVFVAFTGSVAIISDINPTILSTSRLSFAWARDHIVPEKLTELNKYNVPKWTLLINAIMAIIIILLAQQFMHAVMMINMAFLLIYLAITLSALVLPFKHPEIFKRAQFKFKMLPVVALAGLLTSAVFLFFILRMENATSGFLLLLTWLAVGSLLYIFTQEKHRLHWRLQRQHRKEKEKADENFIKKIWESVEDKIGKEKK